MARASGGALVLWAAVISFFALLASVAHAQDAGGWVVVVASTEDAGDAASRAAARAQDHLQSAGQRVLTGPALDQRIAASVSRPFAPLTPAESSQLTTVTEAAAQQVMYGDDDGTVRSATAAIAGLEDRLAAVGRDDGAARRIGDLCLYAVRAHLHARAPDAARRQVRECLRVSPDINPSPAAHPAEVRRLVEEQRSALPLDGVRLQMEITTAEGCRVRVQGRPLQLGVALPPGRYQVQVECGDEAGRVHDLALAPNATFAVDASLDAALANRDGLTLRYAGEDALRSRLPRHVQLLGSGLRVANVLVVRNGEGDALTLERFEIDAGGARRVAYARIALSADERLPPALDALVAGRSVELSEEVRTSEPAAPRGDAPSTAPNVLGPVLVGIAGLGLVGVAGYGVFAGEQCVARDTGPGEACARYERPSWLGIGIWGGLGLAAVTGAVVWLVVGAGDDQVEVGLGPGRLTLGGTL